MKLYYKVYELESILKQKKKNYKHEFQLKDRNIKINIKKNDNGITTFTIVPCFSFKNLVPKSIEFSIYLEENNH